MSATRIARWLGIVCLILALGIGAFLIAARQPAIDPIAPPPKTSFAPDVIKRGASPANDLPFPLNIRTVVLGWDLLFLRAGPFRPDGNHDEAWNRGAYLVDGLGHCGACHTPRNFLGAEKSNQDLSGGESEGWTAYALNAESPAPVRWSADALVHYLTFGFEANHGAARGPMAAVADDLHSDIRAMAIYLADRAGQARASAGKVQRQQAAQSERGKAGVANSADSQTAVTHAVRRHRSRFIERYCRA